MSKLKWRASVSPYPQGFASKGTFKLVSSSPHGTGFLGSRSDQGGSRIGCLQATGRFTGPDRSTKNLDGLPPRCEGTPPHVHAFRSQTKGAIRLQTRTPSAAAAWKT